MLEGHLQAPFVGAALVALRYTALAGIGPDQASPQHAPLVGAALVAWARNGHQQALGWAALVTPVTPATAPLVAAVEARSQEVSEPPRQVTGRESASRNSQV